MDPAAVAQRQLDAYNARDVDAFVATYADDAQQYAFPDKLISNGNKELTTRYRKRFQDPKLHAELLHRMIAGNLVIDCEKVTDSSGITIATAVYEVTSGKITRAWFISAPTT